MTSFEEAYRVIIGQIEGGYANDPDDKGGETYAGIARKYNLSWPGWKIIDGKKSFENFELTLKDDDELQILVKQYYKEFFWDRFAGDSLNPFVATEVFDQVVNFGLQKGIEHFQRTINLLNRNAKLYPDISVGGGFGEQTFTGYKNCVAHNPVGLIVNVLNGYQVKRYIEIMEANTSQEKYIGWFNRVQIIKY